jgi:hypothetical protein
LVRYHDSLAAPDEAFGGRTISLGLKICINNLAILVNSPSQVVLLAIDLHEDFIDKEGVTESTMTSSESVCVFGTEFITPEPDGFVANSDASFSQEIFYISMT